MKILRLLIAGHSPPAARRVDVSWRIGELPLPISS